MILSVVAINGLFVSGNATIATALTPENPVVNSTDTVDFTQISNWHLFGVSQSLANASDTSIASSDTELKLRGVFFLGSQHKAHAIIEASDQTQKAYRVNDQLPNGAILLAIENEKVTLLTNNQQTSLPLSHFESSQDVAETPPSE